MLTTSRTRRALVAVSGTVLTLSMLTACSESKADDPAPTDDTGNSADDWDRRLDKLEEYDKQSQPPYVGDPWERRLLERQDR